MKINSEVFMSLANELRNEGKREGKREGIKEVLFELLDFVAPTVRPKYEAALNAAKTLRELRLLETRIKKELATQLG